MNFLHVKNTTETRIGLTVLGKSRKSGPGRLEKQIAELVRSTYPLQDSTSDGKLLPLVPLFAEKFLRKEAEVQGVEKAMAEEKWLLTLGVVVATNFLYCAGDSKYPILPKAFGTHNPVQKSFVAENACSNYG